MIDQGVSRRGFLGAAVAAGWLGAAVRGQAEERSDGYHIGCYTRPWDQHEYRVALDAIAEAGFKHVGLMSASGTVRLIVTADMTPEAADRIGAEVKQRRLEAISVYGGFTVDESDAKMTESLKRLIDRCAATGSPNLLLGGTTNPAIYDAYYRAIAACCDHAADRGIGLTIKPHGGQNATGPQCRKAIEAVGRPEFRLMYDPGNIFYYSDGSLDPVADAAAVDGLVVGMCVKDFRPPKDVNLTPGKGKVDFKAVLARLRQGGFSGGPLVIECLDPGDLATVTAEAKRTREFVEELVRQVGSA